MKNCASRLCTHPKGDPPPPPPNTQIANRTKMARKYINCVSARPTPPHTNPMESGPGNNFRLKIEKKIKRFKDSFFSTFLTPPPSLETSKKWVSREGV